MVRKKKHNSKEVTALLPAYFPYNSEKEDTSEKKEIPEIVVQDEKQKKSDESVKITELNDKAEVKEAVKPIADTKKEVTSLQTDVKTTVTSVTQSDVPSTNNDTNQTSQENKTVEIKAEESPVGAPIIADIQTTDNATQIKPNISPTTGTGTISQTGLANGNQVDNAIIAQTESMEEENHKGWKYYLQLIFITFFVTFLSIDIVAAYLNIQSKKIISPIAGATFSVASVPKKTIRKEVIGFLPSWMISQKVKVETRNLTQLIYFGLGVNEDGELRQYDEEGNALMEWSYLNSDYFKNIQNEAKYSKTKILLSITNFDNTSIDKLVSNPQATKALIKNVLQIMDQYQFDGININFEYVTDSDFPTAVYLNKFLDTFVKELKKEKPGTILSFDINALAAEEDGAYDMVKIGEIVDQVILMGYDYHRTDSSIAGPVAPIDGANEHSISKSLKSMVGRVPNEKLILGLPFYGYEWQTVNKNHKSPTVVNTGAVASYKRVKELLKNREDIKVEWDEDSESPWFSYIQSGAIKQIYYEDGKSLQKKLDLVNDKKMQGIAIWALGYEGDSDDLWNVINTWRDK